jgi:hypothetical protein
MNAHFSDIHPKDCTHAPGPCWCNVPDGPPGEVDGLPVQFYCPICCHKVRGISGRGELTWDPPRDNWVEVELLEGKEHAQFRREHGEPAFSDISPPGEVMLPSLAGR